MFSCCGKRQGIEVGFLVLFDWAPGHAALLEFAFAGVEARVDFAQALGLGFLTKEHESEVIPTGESYGALFTIGLFDQLEKMMAVAE